MNTLGTTLEAATQNEIVFPEGGVTLDKAPQVGPPEFRRNVNRCHLGKIEATRLVKSVTQHANDTVQNKEDPMILRGPGGIGKTTALLTLAKICLESGYMCIFIQLKQFANFDASAVSDWADSALFDFARDELFESLATKNPWRFIPINEQIPNVSCYDFLDFISKVPLDDALSLFAMHLLCRRLLTERRVPILICLDQWNSLEREYWTINGIPYCKDSHPIAKNFLHWERARRAVVIQALSSSCGADVARGGDGNENISHFVGRVWPEDLAVQFVGYIKTQMEKNPQDNDKDIAKLCGYIPREMIRFFIRGDRQSYMSDASESFRFRVTNLMSRDSVESLKYSAYVYMHCARWHTMPKSWAVSGVMHENGTKWVCEAARKGFFDAFREQNESLKGALAALRIFADESTTHGTALELAMIHHFNVFGTFRPDFGFSDLQGKAKKGLSLSFRCSNIQFIQKEDSDSSEQLTDGTVYILWTGAAVVDFFVYESRSHYAWLQMSKSQYSAHTAKADDIFKPAPNYPINRRSKQHHSPYSYFKSRMPRMGRGSSTKTAKSFMDNEYYFYLTPRKANLRRNLTPIERKNCFLVAGTDFQNLLKDQVCSCIKTILDEVIN